MEVFDALSIIEATESIVVLGVANHAAAYSQLGLRKIGGGVKLSLELRLVFSAIMKEDEDESWERTKSQATDFIFVR